MDKYTCSVRPCGASGPADKMFNLSRKDTGGKLVAVCGRCAADARRHDLKAYRLSDTLKRDAAETARRLASSSFFQAYKKAAEKKDGKDLTLQPSTATS